VVRRVLLRRNIAVDAETVQLVAAAVQAALQADAPSRLARRRPRAPATGSESLFWPGIDRSIAGQAPCSSPKPVPGPPRSKVSMVTGLSCPAAANSSALSRRSSLSAKPQAWRRRNLRGPAPAALPP
jgi:hypothetical protein